MHDDKVSTVQHNDLDARVCFCHASFKIIFLSLLFYEGDVSSWERASMVTSYVITANDQVKAYAGNFPPGTGTNVRTYEEFVDLACEWSGQRLVEMYNTSALARSYPLVLI